MRFLQNIVLYLAMLHLMGCAGMTATPISDDADDNSKSGVRYYEPAPHLLVYSDGKGNLSSTILMMPDMSKKMRIDLHSFAAKNNTKLTFNNGMLTNVNSTFDATKLPSQVISSIKTLGVAAVSAAFNEPENATTRTVPAPYLFKIVIDEDGTRLKGGQGLGPKKPDGTREPLDIKVTVTSEAVVESSKGGAK